MWLSWQFATIHLTCAVGLPSGCVCRCPDVAGMQTRQPNLEGAGEMRLRRLVKEVLRMRPSLPVG